MKETFVTENEGLKINVLGDRQLVKLTGSDTDGQIAVIIQNLPPGIELPNHVHTREDEHFHLMEGEVRFEVGDKSYMLKGGDMIYLPRGIPHSLKVISDVPAKVRLSIVPAGIEAMFEEIDKLPEGPPDISRLAEICNRYGVSFL